MAVDPEVMSGELRHEVQEDGSVIQYNLRGDITAHFENDEACADATGIKLYPNTPPVAEELREGAGYLIGKLTHNVLGGRPHAA